MKKLFKIADGLTAVILVLCLALSASAFRALAASGPGVKMSDPQTDGDPTVILVVLKPGRTDTPIDLFLNAYGGTVLSERTVIAPGTENSVSVRFSEPNGVPFSYKVYLKTEVLQGGVPSDTKLPLMILAEGGSYRPFSDWEADGDGLLVKQGSLSAGKQGSLNFSWKWDFERGDDAGDVALSTLSDLSAIVRIIVITEAEEPTPEETTEIQTTEEPTTEAPTTEAPTTEAPTTEEPTTEEPTTEVPTTEVPTTEERTTEEPTTEAQTTEEPTTEEPTTEERTTEEPTTEEPTTEERTTEEPTTEEPTTEERTTEEPTTEEPTTEVSTTEPPTDRTTVAPTNPPGTTEPSTEAPTNPPRKPDEPKPFGVEDSPAGIIVILFLAAVAGVLLIILYKKNKKKGTRNE